MSTDLDRLRNLIEFFNKIHSNLNEIRKPLGNDNLVIEKAIYQEITGFLASKDVSAQVAALHAVKWVIADPIRLSMLSDDMMWFDDVKKQLISSDSRILKPVLSIIKILAADPDCRKKICQNKDWFIDLLRLLSTTDESVFAYLVLIINNLNHEVDNKIAMEQKGVVNRLIGIIQYPGPGREHFLYGAFGLSLHFLKEIFGSDDDRKVFFSSIVKSYQCGNIKGMYYVVRFLGVLVLDQSLHALMIKEPGVLDVIMSSITLNNIVIQREGLLTLKYLTVLPDSRLVINELSGFIACLKELISHQDKKIQKYVLGVLINLAHDRPGQVAILKVEGLLSKLEKFKTYEDAEMTPFVNKILHKLSGLVAVDCGIPVRPSLFTGLHEKRKSDACLDPPAKKVKPTENPESGHKQVVSTPSNFSNLTLLSAIATRSVGDIAAGLAHGYGGG